jgi:transposase
VSIEQIARDFGIHQTTLNTWLRAAYAEEGPRSTAAPDVLRENRDLKRRNRLLEQENEVLRRAAAYLSQASLPGKGFTRS